MAHYTLTRALKHDGVLYAEGDAIVLKAASTAAAHLLATGTITSAAADDPKAPKGEGKRGAPD